MISHDKCLDINGAGWVPFTEMLKPQGLEVSIAPVLPHTLGTKSVSFWLLVVVICTSFSGCGGCTSCTGSGAQ